MVSPSNWNLCHVVSLRGEGGQIFVILLSDGVLRQGISVPKGSAEKAAAVTALVYDRFPFPRVVLHLRKDGGRGGLNNPLQHGQAVRLDASHPHQSLLPMMNRRQLLSLIVAGWSGQGKTLTSCIFFRVQHSISLCREAARRFKRTFPLVLHTKVSYLVAKCTTRPVKTVV